MTFITSPNQRKVTIHKCDGKKNYSKIDRTANKKAMSKLGYSAYMLYMLFCMNATDFEMILSKAAICSETNLTKNVYYEAFYKLVDEGYLISRHNSKCLYDFYEDPSLATVNNPETGKACPQKRESTSPNQVENIKKYGNIARGGAIALPTGDENGTSTATTGPRTRRLFVDM